MAVHERSTAAVLLTFKDENGDLISVGAITAFTVEVFDKAGTAIITDNTIPTVNPYLFPLDLKAFDIDAVGSVLRVCTKVTYNSSTLGTGAVVRSGPTRIDLVNSRITA